MTSQIFNLSMTALTVWRNVYLLRQFSDVDLESVLDLIQDLCIVFIRHERDRQSLCSKSSSSSHLDKHKVFRYKKANLSQSNVLAAFYWEDFLE